MKPEKLKGELADRLAETREDEVLEVVVELAAREETTPDAGAGAGGRGASRRERIAALREAFDREREPVERAILEAGGEVTERAWINQTLKARVSAAGLERLSDMSEVAALDTPRQIELDEG